MMLRIYMFILSDCNMNDVIYIYVYTVAENQNHEGEGKGEAIVVEPELLMHTSSPQTPNVAVLMDQIRVALLDMIERNAIIDRMLDMMVSLLAKHDSHEDADDTAQA